MTQIEFSNFLEGLNGIDTFVKRIEYCNKRLKKIARGSGRFVYEFDDAKIFKLAVNQEGLMQNAVEASFLPRWTDRRFEFLANVLDSNDCKDWVVAEKAGRVTLKKFKELTGFKLKDVYFYLVNCGEVRRGNEKRHLLPVNIENNMNGDNFIIKFEEFVFKYDIHFGDLSCINTYGEILRNGKPTAVLVDYGLTNDIYDKHYNKK
ncbi:MAG: hypothetical protein WC333_00735 [Dehalococcoidia bacterium]|jgi:hypothetical protein